MADQIDTLKQLQVVDGEIYRLRKQEQEKPRELERLAAEVAAQDAKVKAAEDRMRTLQLAQKEREVELQTREANVKKLQGQLFQLKTNREYATMQHEISTTKADNSLLEEEVLKLFDAIDQAKQVRQEEQQRLAKEQERLQAERTRIERELNEIRDRVAQLERERQGMAVHVTPDWLAVYQRVLQVREGLALVPVMASACGGCHRRLPPQVINEVYLKAKLVMCESCSRILYFDDAVSKL